MEVSVQSQSKAGAAEETTASAEVNPDLIKSFKHIPLRLYKGDKIMPMILVKPVRSSTGGASLSSDRLTTLQDLLDEFNIDSSSGEPTTLKLNGTLHEFLYSFSAKLVTQGIEPDLQTPVQWLSEHLSYPDNFLHVCIK